MKIKAVVKKIGSFLKKHIFSVVCLLLAVAISISGTVSYSKYLTSSGHSGGATAGSFYTYASIDGISSLSFTNTAFWGGTTKNDNTESGNSSSDKIAMNALRQIKFSVNNYQIENEIKKVADVRMRYNLVFSAPVTFVNKLAFQVFDGNDVAILPQIVISDLLNAVPSPSTSTSSAYFNTAYSEDYNSQPCQTNSDIIFEVSGGIDSTITATSQQGITITLSKFSREVDQTLLFRQWDVSEIASESNIPITSEGGKLMAPIAVSYKANVEFYKISITMPEFVLPAGVETTVNHTIQLAPTDALEDPYLGSSLVVKDGDTYSSISTLYGRLDKDGNIENGYQSNIYLQSVVEKVTENGKETTNNVYGEIVNYVVGKPITTEYSYQEKNDLTNDSGSTTGSTEPGTTTTIDTTYSTIGNITLVDTAPTLSNYNLGYVATDTTTSNYGTTFYIHKLKACQSATETTTVTSVTTEIVSKTKVTDTNITETITTESVVGNTFNLKVSKVTTVEVSQNTVLKITTTTTTTTRDCTLEGFVYRGYYKDSANDLFPQYITSTTVLNSDGNKEGVSLGVDYLTGTDGNKYDFILHDFNVVNGTYSDGTTTTTTTIENKIESERIENECTNNTVEIDRTIERTYNYTADPLEIDEVSCTKTSIDQNGSTTTETTYYTEESKLNLYNSENIQQYYLSSSYSKNYPFYVDVVFEQILN